MQPVRRSGVASKEYIDSLGKHERTINILIAFTDFQQFRIMMNTRALGSKKKKTSAIVGLEHHEAGHTQVSSAVCLRACCAMSSAEIGVRWYQIKDMLQVASLASSDASAV